MISQVVAAFVFGFIACQRSGHCPAGLAIDVVCAGPTRSSQKSVFPFLFAELWLRRRRVRHVRAGDAMAFAVHDHTQVHLERRLLSLSRLCGRKCKCACSLLFVLCVISECHGVESSERENHLFLSFVVERRGVHVRGRGQLLKHRIVRENKPLC